MLKNTRACQDIVPAFDCPVDPQKVRRTGGSQEASVAPIEHMWRPAEICIQSPVMIKGMGAPFLNIDCRSYDAGNVGRKGSNPDAGINGEEARHVGLVLVPRIPTANDTVLRYRQQLGPIERRFAESTRWTTTNGPDGSTLCVQCSAISCALIVCKKSCWLIFTAPSCRASHASA